MKKKYLTALVFSCMLAPVLFAQDKDSVVTLPSVTITSYGMINKEVNKSFEKSFPEAENLRWYKQNKDYLAKFIKDDLKHQSLFKKNGMMKYDIMYAFESNLPDNIREIVKNAYDAYEITSAAKITRADQEFWIVNLDGISSFLIVRVEDGQLEEVKKVVKSE